MTFQTKQKLRNYLKIVGVTAFACLVMGVFLMPFGYGVLSSLKTEAQLSKVEAPLLPSSEASFTYEGKDYPVYQVPLESGTKKLALVKKKRKRSFFIDPKNPEAGQIEWKGSWRTLEPLWQPDVQWDNYPKAWNAIDFFGLLRNTLMYAIISTIGAVSSSAFVAYGFARYNIPKKNLLFMIVMATIILPPAVTLIPRYAFFHTFGLVPSWIPIILPVFFSNGYNVFLLRQFFMGVPREMDEAAKIDGAGPLRIFFSVVLPQSVPALVAVTLFHFFYCWNDFIEPLIFLAGRDEIFPITIGLTKFNKLYTQQIELIQAASIMSLIIPLTIFFLAQRYFMQGVVMTGVDK
jgi:multiple sugar transport system permease protein